MQLLGNPPSSSAENGTIESNRTSWKSLGKAFSQWLYSGSGLMLSAGSKLRTIPEIGKFTQNSQHIFRKKAGGDLTFTDSPNVTKWFATSVGRKVSNVPIATTLTLSKTDIVRTRPRSQFQSLIRQGSKESEVIFNDGDNPYIVSIPYSSGEQGKFRLFVEVREGKLKFQSLIRQGSKESEKGSRVP